jgi:hypothetical protein
LPNTLTRKAVRLPLGASNARKEPFKGSMSWFTLRNPTRFGGDLTIRCRAAEGEMMRLRRSLDGPDLAISGTGELRYPIPNGAEHVGEYNLMIDVPEAEASATLVQVGVSREGPNESDRPFAPWNFWYWPTKRSGDFELPFEESKAEKEERKRYEAEVGVDPNYWTTRARKVLLEYGRLVKHTDPDAIVRWEVDYHQSPAKQGWEGHCDFAAIASILFEPPEGKVSPGLSFRSSDMELLAAEFAGQYANPSQQVDIFRLDENPIAANVGILDLLSPEGHCNRHELTEAVKAIAPADTKAGPAGQKLMVDKFMAQFEAKYAGNGDKVKAEFGRRGAALFSALQGALRGRWSACVGDFRSANREDGPEPVWNHALFMYEAEFVESAPTNDDKRYDIQCRLICNIDTPPEDSDGVPARLVGKKLVTIPGKHVPYEHRYRLSLDATGDVMLEKQPVWLQCRGPGDVALRAPRYLKQVVGPKKSPSGTGNAYGNANVTWDVISKGLLKLRKRYQ